MKSFSQNPEELEEFLDFLEQDLQNIRRVRNFCEEKDIDADFFIHAKAETVQESAENTGVEPGEVVKTLVFKSEDGFVAVLCPGDTSVDEEELEEVLGGKVEMASPSEVEEETGYIVGGVSPFDLDIRVLMEEEILERDTVKPSAGSRLAGVRIEPEELKRAIEPEVVDVSR
jgi:Cys-tRNA(Pro) deacylase